MATHPVLDFLPQPESYQAGDLKVPETVQKAEELSALQLVETILHQSDTPPCAIINDACNTVYIHGRTGRFLEPAEGKASVNIVEMARPGLKKKLAAAIRQVATNKQEAVCRDLKVDHNGGKSKTNDDMKNLLDSTEIATIFLDTELRVRRFTPRATDIVPLTAADSGRPIKHLATTLINTDIAEYGRKVLRDLAVRQVEYRAGRR